MTCLKCRQLSLSGGIKQLMVQPGLPTRKLILSKLFKVGSQKELKRDEDEELRKLN